MTNTVNAAASASNPLTVKPAETSANAGKDSVVTENTSASPSISLNVSPAAADDDTVVNQDKVRFLSIVFNLDGKRAHNDAFTTVILRTMSQIAGATAKYFFRRFAIVSTADSSVHARYQESAIVAAYKKLATTMADNDKARRSALTELLSKPNGTTKMVVTQGDLRKIYYDNYIAQNAAQTDFLADISMALGEADKIRQGLSEGILDNLNKINDLYKSDCAKFCQKWASRQIQVAIKACDEEEQTFIENYVRHQL